MTEFAKAYGDYIAKMLLQELEAGMMLTPEEKIASYQRAETIRLQWKVFKRRMLEKNGTDGGPSPAVIMDEPFEPHL